MRLARKFGAEAIVPLLAVVLAAFGLSMLLNDSVTWSNPEYLVFSVPGSVDNGVGFSWEDLRKAFDPLTFDIGRPRFLNFLLTVLNVKARLALYEFFVPPVNLSLMLLAHLLLSPLLLFLAVRNLVNSRAIALSATCLYLTSVGFLSTAVWFVQPGKILIHPMTIFLVWILTLMNREDGNKYFSEHRRVLVAAVCALNLVALSIDDTYAITAIVACVLFWRLFVPRRLDSSHLRRSSLAATAFFASFIVFALFVWKIAPGISAAVGVGECDYIGFILDQSGNAARTPFWQVFPNLAMTALASGLLPHPFPEGISPVALKLTTAATIGLVAIFIVVGALVLRRNKLLVQGGNNQGPFIVDALLALGVYFILQAFVQRFHVQITGGYYYASLGAIFWSILCAFLIANLPPSMRLLGHGAVLVLIVIQLGNFVDLNRRWKTMHIDLIPYSLSQVRAIYENVIVDDGMAPTPEQRERMNRIWSEWKNGRRVDLSQEPAWPASQAWFLVEMNALSGFVYRDPIKRCR